MTTSGNEQRTIRYLLITYFFVLIPVFKSYYFTPKYRGDGNLPEFNQRDVHIGIKSI